MGAQAVELRVVERATAAERELDAAKVHLVETEAALQKALEALEVEQKARSDTEQEVVALWGQVLEAKESNALLLKKVTQKRKDSPSSKVSALVRIYSAFS